jgi:hypothetical protein
LLIVREKELNVNILEELEQFDWEQGKVRGLKWLSCSPFRSEKNPSFAIHLEDGTYIDSGSDDPYWRKGNLQKLMSYFWSTDIEEVEQYLLEKYSPFHMNTDDMELNLNLSHDRKPQRVEISLEILNRYKHPNPYLTNERRVKQEVLDEFNIGYAQRDNVSTFVWTDKKGIPVNIKFRRTDNKKFFYLPSGEPIKNHLFLYHDIWLNKRDTVFITEAEIDALYIRNLSGFYSIATGGANLSEAQERLLLASPCKKIVLCFDNDEAGKRVSDYTKKKLMGYKEVFTITLPNGVKDVNELPLSQLKDILENPVAPTFTLF